MIRNNPGNARVCPGLQAPMHTNMQLFNSHDSGYDKATLSLCATKALFHNGSLHWLPKFSALLQVQPVTCSTEEGRRGGVEPGT